MPATSGCSVDGVVSTLLPIPVLLYSETLRGWRPRTDRDLLSAAVGAVFTSSSTIVVAINARRLKGVDLSA